LLEILNKIEDIIKLEESNLNKEEKRLLQVIIEKLRKMPLLKV